MKFISDIYWDKGLRENNQDSLILEQVVTVKGRVLLAAVSDGVGGLLEGEIASGFILEKVHAHFYDEILPLIRRGKSRKILEKSFHRCFYDINRKLKQYAAGKQMGLGATLSLLLLWKRQYLIMHIGDSRIYGIRSQWLRKSPTIRLLTGDHTRSDGSLYKCLGGFSYQAADAVTGKRSAKMGFLLCSDGFYRRQRSKMLRDLLNPLEIEEEEQIKRRLRQMALHAMNGGEKDNISAIYVCCKS